MILDQGKTTMKTIHMAGIEQPVSAIVIGLMRIMDRSDEQIRELVDAGLSRGVTMLDTADVYGPTDHSAEQRLGDALNWSSSQREKVLLQTKCGIVRENGPYFDFSAERILSAVEGSLKALRTDYIDVLLLHRPDALMEPAEIAGAFDKLHAQGKVRHFGVSNHTVGQIELLKTAVRQPLVANQVQLSITHAPIIAQGVAMNMQALPQSVERAAGLVDYCRLHQITLQAWSPYQAGFFTGSFIGDRHNYKELNDVLDRLAEKYAVPPIAIATAWITRHPANMQVVTGTTNPQRIAGACAGADITLSREEWYELYRAADYLVP
jgi:predicted oxidoreductase